MSPQEQPVAWIPRVGDALAIQGTHLPDGIYRAVYLDPTCDRFTLKLLPETTTKSKSAGDGAKRTSPIHTISALGLKQFVHSANASQVDVIRFARMPDTGQLSEKALKAYEHRKNALGAMVKPELLAELLGPHPMPALVLLAKNFGMTLQQSRRLFHRLLDCGLDVAIAATNGYANCGRGRQAGKELPKKLGRPYRHVKTGFDPLWKGINGGPNLDRCLDLFIASGYKAADNITANFNKFRTTFAVKQIQQFETGNVSRVMLPDNEFWTYSQFRHHLPKRIQARKETLNRENRRVVNARSFRAYVGSAAHRVPTPAHRLIIDSTIADAYLVCNWDRSRLLGRPTVYIVICSLTSTVVGLHVTMHSPSAKQAKIALYRAISDKTSWLTGFGLEAYVDLFPQSPIPAEIVWDRGELHSQDGRDVAASLCVDVGIPGPYMPEWKGIVERFFRTLNDAVIHWLPGSTRGLVRERGNKDVRLDAVLTMHEFIALLINSILIWNLRGQSSTMVRPEAIADGATPGPVGNWSWGMKNLHGSPTFLSRDEAIVRLLEPQPCEIGDHGIMKENFHWVGDWMGDPDLALRGVLLQPARIYPNPDMARTSFIRMQGENILRPAYLAPDWAVNDENSLEDLEDFVAHSLQTGTLHGRKTEGFETSALASSQKIITAATKATTQAHNARPQSKAAYVTDARSARKEAQAREGLPETFPVGPAIKRADTTSTPPQSSANQDFMEGWAAL